MLATHPRLPGGLGPFTRSDLQMRTHHPRRLTGRASVSHARVTSYEISRRPSPFFSATYKMLFAQLLCFENDPFSWGVQYSPPPPAPSRRREPGYLLMSSFASSRFSNGWRNCFVWSGAPLMAIVISFAAFGK